jgi:RNA polymerase sigma-70 factor (ECF subfamily)
MGDAPPEATLVAAARDGDRAAFDRLVRAHFGGVYGVLFRMVGNHEDAEDLAQETFVRAWKALGGFRAEAPLRPWLTRIAVRLAMDHFRARGRGAAVVQLDAFSELTQAAGDQPVARLNQRELEAAMARAVEHLPPRLRAALVLRVLEGREYDEVATALDLRPNTVRALVVKARRLLWRHLAPLLGSEPGEALR